MSEEFLNFIDILRKRRIELGYSMRGLARESGTNHSYIFDLEHSCSARIDIEKIIKICDVLELDFYKVLVQSGLISSNKKIECYKIDVYVNGEFLYECEVNEASEEKALDLLSNYLYSNDIIKKRNDCRVCYSIMKKKTKNKNKKNMY